MWVIIFIAVAEKFYYIMCNFKEPQGDMIFNCL